MKAALMTGVGKLTLVLLAAVLVTGSSWAQQKDPRVNPPVMPVGEESTSKAPGEAPGKPAGAVPVPTVTPDQQPISNGNWLGLGFWDGGRSYMTMGFSVSSGFDTNSQNTSNPGWQARSNVTGRLGLQRVWGTRQLNFSYSTGGQIYNTRTSATGRRAAMVHSFGLSHSMSLRRWTISVNDSLSYLPESGFGGGGLGLGRGGFGGGGFGGGFGGGLGGGVGIPGITVPGGNPFTNPGQSILTGQGARISNSVGGQVGYSLSPRATITANSAFSLLRFLSSGNFVESNGVSFGGGFNYMLNAKDTVAVSYAGQRLRFQGATGGVNAHNFHVSYARRVTGRMALQVSGGPNLNQVRSPSGVTIQRQSWSGMFGAQYKWPNLSLGLRYTRATTDGSGVLMGADTQGVTFSAGRQITRMWNGSLRVSYARNSSLSALSGGNTLNVNSWHGGFSLNRPVGRYMSLDTSYNVQYQNRDLCAALPTACVPSSMRHVFSLGFSWQYRPIDLE